IAATLIAGRIEKTLPATAQPALRHLEDMLQQSIREVRTVSYLLHPPLLDEAGLGLALCHYIEGFQERAASRGGSTSRPRGSGSRPVRERDFVGAGGESCPKF